MDTSLRYDGESSALRIATNKNPPTVKYAGNVSALKIHAKQKLQIDSNTLLQLNGELDTGTGLPNFLVHLLDTLILIFQQMLELDCIMIKMKKSVVYCVEKKAYPVASKRSVNFVLKGHCYIEQELTQPTPHGALELVWNILDFQKEQDVRLKVGFEIIDKIPYVQIRENNWTFNADANGRWNVRYHL